MDTKCIFLKEIIILGLSYLQVQKHLIKMIETGTKKNLVGPEMFSAYSARAVRRLGLTLVLGPIWTDFVIVKIYFFFI